MLHRRCRPTDLPKLGIVGLPGQKPRTACWGRHQRRSWSDGHVGTARQENRSGPEHCRRGESERRMLVHDGDLLFALFACVAWLCRSRLIATTNCGEQESAHRCSVQDPASIQRHDGLPQGPDNSGTRFFGYCIAGDMTVRLPHPHGPSQGWPDAFIANPIEDYTNGSGARINPAGPQWSAGSGPSEVLWTVWNSDA